MTYVIIVLLGAASFGILSTFVKIAYGHGFVIGEVVGSQTLFGMMMLWLLVVVRGYYINRKRPPISNGVYPSRIKLSQMLKLMAVGTTTGITGILYYSALQYITVSLAIILLFQFTWLGVLLESIINRKWPSKGKLYALALLFIGTIIASGLSIHSLEEVSWLGISFGLLSAVSYTLFILFSGKVELQIPALKRSAFMLTGSTVMTLLIFPPLFLFNGAIAQGLWLWGGILALFGAVIPPLFFSYGVPHIGSGLATILGAIELPVAIGMAFFVMKEQVTMLQIIGVITILFGVALPELMRRRSLG